MMGWISVSDKLPEKFKEVLFYEKYCDLPVIGYLGEDGKWHADRSAFEHVVEEQITSSDVIYWMPLPYLPGME